MNALNFPPTSISFLGCLLLVISLASCSTTRKASKDIDNSFETAAAFQQGFAGFVLYDPHKKKVLYEHNAEKYFTPASNTKLFTFFTGLKLLGDSVPALKYSVKNDSLIFWGTGDPTFLHPEFPDSNIFEFLKNRKEKLFYAPPGFEEDHFGPGWAWGDYNAYYSVERGAFPVFGNTVTFSFSPFDSIPVINPGVFQNSLEVAKTGSRTYSSAQRELSSNKFTYRHFHGNKERVQQVPFKYSSELIVQVLNDTLKKEVSMIAEVPDHFTPVKKIFSAPTDSLYKQMLQVSDNFIAEQILLLSAGELSDTLKTSIAIKEMKKRYLKDLPDEPQWVDGSGLSRYNLFTPRTMIKLLEKIQKEVPTEQLFKLLPTGGESGTLKNSYKNDPPYIFAKTGTLKNNHSLSGYIKTKKGKVFIFSFMNSNYIVPSPLLKMEMEKILKTIYLNY